MCCCALAHLCLSPATTSQVAGNVTDLQQRLAEATEAERAGPMGGSPWTTLALFPWASGTAEAPTATAAEAADNTCLRAGTHRAAVPFERVVASQAWISLRGAVYQTAYQFSHDRSPSSPSSSSSRYRARTG